jgi:hypothetical protein
VTDLSGLNGDYHGRRSGAALVQGIVKRGLPFIGPFSNKLKEYFCISGSWILAPKN